MYGALAVGALQGEMSALRGVWIGEGAGMDATRPQLPSALGVGVV